MRAQTRRELTLQRAQHTSHRVRGVAARGCPASDGRGLGSGHSLNRVML
jgi:hypothetical protein